MSIKILLTVALVSISLIYVNEGILTLNLLLAIIVLSTAIISCKFFYHDIKYNQKVIFSCLFIKYISTYLQKVWYFDFMIFFVFFSMVNQGYRKENSKMDSRETTKYETKSGAKIQFIRKFGRWNWNSCFENGLGNWQDQTRKYHVVLYGWWQWFYFQFKNKFWQFESQNPIYVKISGKI